MASATNLVLKVSADTKDATKQLKTVGVNIEDVATKTKKASQEASVWNDSMQKAYKDNYKNLINMGAKVLTISTAVNLVSKGIKSCFDEAVKRDAEAGKRLDEINSTWSDIKADLGSGLLDAVSPALDALYEQLQNISKWINQYTTGKSIVKMAKENLKGGQNDLTVYSAEVLQKALKTALNNNEPEVVSIIQQALGVVNNRGGSAASDANTLASYNGTLGGGTADLQWSLRHYQNSLAVTDDGRAAAKAKYGFYAGNYSTEYGKYLNQAGTAYWDGNGWSDIKYLQSTGASTTSSSNGLNWGKSSYDTYWEQYGKHVSQQHTGEVGLLEKTTPSDQSFQESLQKWANYYNQISSYANQTFSAISSLIDQTYENQIAEIEASGNSEEEIANETAELKEKQFNANKANSIAQAAIDTASAIMNIWATNGGVPAVAGVLTALASATGAAQIATISSQKYTGLAVGGIVSSPTLTKLGEGGEKEAVLPLSKLRDFVQESTPTGSIAITVNVADGTRSSEIANDVYYAIERAQRTGLLPKWKYA